MYFDSSTVCCGCCVLFSRSELFETRSFLVGSGVSSRDVRVVRRLSKPESPSILVCLFSSWLHSEVFSFALPSRLVSNPQDEKRLKILLFSNSISTINFNKISFSLDTSKKLHFAAKTFHFLCDPLSLPWLQPVDCGELIEKGRKIIGEIILQLSERDENSFHKNFFLPFHTRTNFLVNAPIEQKILKNARRFHRKSRRFSFELKIEKKTFGNNL